MACKVNLLWKGHKIWKQSPIDSLTFTHKHQTTKSQIFFQIFMDFSENPNFSIIVKLQAINLKKCSTSFWLSSDLKNIFFFQILWPFHNIRTLWDFSLISLNLFIILWNLRCFEMIFILIFHTHTTKILLMAIERWKFVPLKL